jgi:predicted AAA+ superfamily ATPase
MRRKIYNQLLEWKKAAIRKPLLLQGARQVGKTFLINEFGKNEYQQFIYLNFEQSRGLKTLFTGSLNPDAIIHNIGLFIGKKISIHDTLIFFDEIQEVPEAITSLKYFYEQRPEYHIIAAGSLLGVSVGKQGSFPVGKVNFMNLYPMTFFEYLQGFDEELLVESLLSIRDTKPLAEPIHEKLLSHLKMYLFLGGMPEVLQNYKDNRDIAWARKIQDDILQAYKRDFSKYTDKIQSIRTSELWNSIPYQLAKENKKFKYSDVKKKARASTFEQTIEWLKNAGLINLSYNISVPKLPLAGYTDYTKFKVYLMDTGLLGAMLKLTSDIIIKPTELFSEYNGAFIENFIASELSVLNSNELYYWTSKSDAEVDFILQVNNHIIPIEVKSGLKRDIKSLRSYQEKYHPAVICRLSPRNFNQDNEFINAPLYAVSIIVELFKKIGL